MTLQDKAVSYISSNPNCSVTDIIGAVGCQKSVAYGALSAWQKVREISTDKPCKNVVAIGDFHCGHKVGLTPPEWWCNPYFSSLRAKQEEMWEFYSHTLKNLGKIDILFVNGDCIDGKGTKSGGTELITTNRHEQSDIATRCIQEANADKVYMTFGTPYHSGVKEDFEIDIAKDVGAVKIADQLWVDVNGLVFDVKHSTGSSTVPYGRSSSTAKAKTWNREWAEVDNQPKADVFIRSHVHYNNYNGNSQFLAMTLHALQGPETKFGGRKCEGTVSVGITNFKIKKGDTVETLDWRFHTCPLNTFKQELLVA